MDKWMVVEIRRAVPGLDVGGVGGVERSLYQLKFVVFLGDHQGSEARGDAELFRLAVASP